MSFGKYGVSTMNVRKYLLITVLLGMSLLLLPSCGKKNGSSDTAPDTTAAATDTTISEEKAIEQMLNEVITRLRYGDKSGLYENEFEYFTDEYTFDEYLDMMQVKYARADTIVFVEVRNVTFYDKDSALVDVTVHFEGVTGKKSYLRDKLVLYWHHNRWIKPTVSVIDLELAYEEKIRIADSVAAAEAAEEEGE